MHSKISFKQYLVEMAVHTQVVFATKQLLNAADIEIVNSVSPDTLEKAKEEKHKFVPSAAGNWLISIFHLKDFKFARVEAPRGISKLPTFYTAKGR
jgi:hypothetical protein